MELLYARYGAMLFSYVLQFIPEKARAEEVLIDIFSRLGSRLREACESSLSVYCWMQVEARKIILEYNIPYSSGPTARALAQHVYPGLHRDYPGQHRDYYYSLLEDATPEQQWVFRELFLYGRQQEELALQAGKDTEDISRLLRESLLIIRKRLG